MARIRSLTVVEPASVAAKTSNTIVLGSFISKTTGLLGAWSLHSWQNTLRAGGVAKLKQKGYDFWDHPGVEINKDGEIWFLRSLKDLQANPVQQLKRVGFSQFQPLDGEWVPSVWVSPNGKSLAKVARVHLVEGLREAAVYWDFLFQVDKTYAARTLVLGVYNLNKTLDYLAQAIVELHKTYGIRDFLAIHHSWRDNQKDRLQFLASPVLIKFSHERDVVFKTTGKAAETLLDIAVLGWDTDHRIGDYLWVASPTKKYYWQYWLRQITTALRKKYEIRYEAYIRPFLEGRIVIEPPSTWTGRKKTKRWSLLEILIPILLAGRTGKKRKTTIEVRPTWTYLAKTGNITMRGRHLADMKLMAKIGLFKSYESGKGYGSPRKITFDLERLADHTMRFFFYNKKPHPLSAGITIGRLYPGLSPLYYQIVSLALRRGASPVEIRKVLNTDNKSIERSIETVKRFQASFRKTHRDRLKNRLKPITKRLVALERLAESYVWAEVLLAGIIKNLHYIERLWASLKTTNLLL